MTGFKVSDKGLYILFAILIVYSTLFIGIAIWNYEHFLLDASGDQLLFEQVVYNTANGKFFYNNFSHQSHFGDHNSPILAVLALFALILPAQYVLSIFTVLAIAIAAIPIYLLSRDLLGNKTLALLLVGIFLMLPALVGQIFVSFHEINLVLPFLTFTFYYFYKERFYLFIATFIMALSVKEDVSITLFMFAPYAALKKRDRQWYLFPAIMSIAWFSISVKAIIPFFNKQKSYGMALNYYGNLGGSLSEIAINTVTAPLKTFKIMLNLDRLRYLFVLLLPFGLVLPLFNAEILFAIPSVFLNMLAENSRFRLYVRYLESSVVFIPRHMSLMATVFLFISAIFYLQKVGERFPQIASQLKFVVVSLLLLLSLYEARYMMHKSNYADLSNRIQNFPSAESINRILTLIPKDATVKSCLYIASHLYDKKEVYYKADNAIETDYVVITGQDEAGFSPDYTAQLRYKYNLIANDEDIVLLKKK